MKQLVLLIFIMFLTFSVYSQKITGTIQSSEIKIASATIEVNGNSKSIVTTSNEHGDFIISNISKGQYVISVKHIEYNLFKTILVVDSQDVHLNIDLTPNIKQIEDVVIKGSKKIIENKADRFIFNLEKTTFSMGNDAFGVLSISPGVTVISGQIGIQGKLGTIIYIDNKRIQADDLESILRSIPAEQIAKIEIIHKPSSKYDADNSAGVILITTKKQMDEGWNLFVSGNTSQGRKFGYGGNAKLDLKFKKIGFSVSTSGLNRGDIEDGENSRIIFLDSSIQKFHQNFQYPNKRLKTYSINSEIIYHLNDKSRFGITYNSISPKLSAEGFVKSSFDQGDLIRTNNTVETGVKFDNYNFFADLLIDSVKMSSLYISGNKSRYSQNSNQFFFSNTDSFNNISNSEFDIYTLSADYNQNLYTNTKIEGGVKYSKTSSNSIQNNSENNFQYKENIQAAYAKIDQNIGKVNVTGGFRIERTNYSSLNIGRDSTYTNLFYNILTTYSVNSNHSLSFFYNKSIKRPSFSNLLPYIIYRDTYSSFQGNPFLKPEYNSELSISSLYKTYSLSLSYSWSKNKILPVFSYINDNSEYRESIGNFNTGDIWSANLFIPIKISPWWTTNINLIGSRSSFEYLYLDKQQFIKREKDNITISNINNIKLGKDWTSSIAAMYISPSMLGIVDISAISNLTIGVKKSFMKNKASLAFELSDIFYDNNVNTYMHYMIVNQQSRINNDTRRGKLTFTYNFGKKANSKGIKEKNTEERTRLGI